MVANIIRPHGRRGEVIADILTDFPERFHERKRLFLIPPARVGTSAREILLENFWFLRTRLVLKLQGIESINEAETLRGYDVAIPLAERAPLDSASVYISDLLGCRVIDLNRSSAEVGIIVDLDRSSSNTDLLVVKITGARGSQEDALIPFVHDYLVRIDLPSRIVEMRLPPGLLAINAPLTDEEKRESRSDG
ncbi:MAG TPA: ribosome maturation factor RimM [Acidobacteriaceae bacterium]